MYENYKSKGRGAGRKRKKDLPQNQWEQFAWHGIRKRSWQTEQTSSSGGTADADEEELISSSPSGLRLSAPRENRSGTRLRSPLGAVSP